MKYLRQLILIAENRTLIQKIQYHLNENELEDLNKQLYKFVKKCLAERPNPTLQKSIHTIKDEFERSNNKRIRRRH